MNIAEGCGRISPAELRRFMEFSMGSASELEYQQQLAVELEYVASDIYQDLTIEIRSQTYVVIIHKHSAVACWSAGQLLC